MHMPTAVCWAAVCPHTHTDVSRLGKHMAPAEVLKCTLCDTLVDLDKNVEKDTLKNIEGMIFLSDDMFGKCNRTQP